MAINRDQLQNLIRDAINSAINSAQGQNHTTPLTFVNNDTLGVQKITSSNWGSPQANLEIQLRELIEKHGIDNIIEIIAQICYDAKDEKMFKAIASVRKGYKKEDDPLPMIL